MIPLSDLTLKHLLAISSIVITAAIFYFSWVPDPNIGNLTFLHGWFSDWINEYGNLRTAVPFFTFAIFFELLYRWDSLKIRIYLIAASLIIVSIAELGQLILPKRHFDPMDVVFGISGTIAGLGVGIFIKSIFGISAKHPG